MNTFIKFEHTEFEILSLETQEKYLKAKKIPKSTFIDF